MDGLVFYAPLVTDANTSTGQNMSVTGNITYDVVDGVPCAYFDGNSYIETLDVSNIPYDGADKTLALWFKGGNGYNTFSQGTNGWGWGQWFVFRCSSSSIGFTGYGGSNDFGFSFEENTGWNVLVVTVSGRDVKIYVNSVLIGNHTMDSPCPTSNTVLRIGTHCYDNDIGNAYTGYLASIRVYNRILTEKEIKGFVK